MKKNPLVAAILFPIPGLSHLYLGKKRKAILLFIIDIGIALALIFSDSYIVRILMLMIYAVTALPAALEAYQLSEHKKKTIDTDSRWYVTILLLTTGFSALPLLWNSPNFSKRAKIIWTAAVPVLAIIFFSLIVMHWETLEKLMAGIFS